jgi:SpoIID/LytB domain protein
VNRIVRRSSRLRTLAGGLLAGVTTAAVLTLPAAPAHAAQYWNVPADARITVLGHGYGHGRGMGQYGAEGAARQGRTHRQILDFYYPGTTWGTADGTMRVKLNADTSDDLVVEARSRLSVRDLGTGTLWQLPENGATRWRVVVGTDGRNTVWYRTDRWRWWKRLSGEGEFAAAGKPVRLVTPSGTRAYRGRLRASAPAEGSRLRDTVNLLSLENYLRGVVPLEMPATWSPAAVRSQAVAARTYSAFERARPAHHYDICDTTSCQVYGGADAEHPASTAAIRETRGEALRYGGDWAFTQFSSSTGGWTARGSFPYLQAKQDPYDGWAGNPNHDWRVVFADEAIERRFPAIGNLRRIVVHSRDGNGEWGGRVQSISFVGGKATRRISGDDARWQLGLKSTWFTFRVGAA